MRALTAVGLVVFTLVALGWIANYLDAREAEYWRKVRRDAQP